MRLGEAGAGAAANVVAWWQTAVEDASADMQSNTRCKSRRHFVGFLRQAGHSQRAVAHLVCFTMAQCTQALLFECRRKLQNAPWTTFELANPHHEAEWKQVAECLRDNLHT